jgi:hypothetical protein
MQSLLLPPLPPLLCWVSCTFPRGVWPHHHHHQHHHHQQQQHVQELSTGQYQYCRLLALHLLSTCLLLWAPLLLLLLYYRHHQQQQQLWDVP